MINNTEWIAKLHSSRKRYAIPSNIIVMGNLDPVNIFKMKTPVELYYSTIELLEKTRTYPNFVISSGCDTPPNVQLENIDAFYQAIADFNKN